MKYTNLVALSMGLLVGVSDALALEKRGPAVAKFDLQKRTADIQAAALKDRLARRQGTIETADQNYKTTLLYLIQLTIGTPPQSTMVQLDTGSSDLIVETSSSDTCTASTPNPCPDFGPYNANTSSTHQYYDSDFAIAYAGGDGASGDYALDTLGIGGATVNNFQFGIMYKSTIAEGILGVPYTGLEGQVGSNGQPPYPNLPVALVNAGYIASRTYGLYTNDDRSAAGTLLFHGVDTKKYIGPLEVVDLIPSWFGGSTTIVDVTVPLNSVSGTDMDGNPISFADGDATSNVIMDSGTTISQLPPTLAQAIWDQVGAQAYSIDPNSAAILCSAASSTETINFAFPGITLTVPLSQLVIFPDGNGVCEFGISKQTGVEGMIADTVLAAMYVVSDLDNYQIAFGQAVLNSTTENIVPIPAGHGKIPGANYSRAGTVNPSATITTSISTTTTTSSTTTPSLTTTSSNSSSSTVSPSITKTFSITRSSSSTTSLTTTSRASTTTSPITSTTSSSSRTTGTTKSSTSYRTSSSSTVTLTSTKHTPNSITMTHTTSSSSRPTSSSFHTSASTSKPATTFCARPTYTRTWRNGRGGLRPV